MTKQTNARISDATRSKLDALTTIYGTQAQVIAVAVDRLYLQEIKPIPVLKFDAPYQAVDTLSDAAMRVCNAQGFNPKKYQILTDLPIDQYDRENEYPALRAVDARGNELIISNSDIYYFTVVMDREKNLATG